MKKLFLTFLTLLFACYGFVSFALAQDLDDLDITDVTCPKEVTAGISFTITVHVENDNEDPNSTTSVIRAVVGYSGNVVSSVGGTNVWGPFPRDISPSLSLPGGGTGSFNLQIKLPTSLRGKMAAIGVSLLSDKNEPAGGGGCIVIVK